MYTGPHPSINTSDPSCQSFRLVSSPTGLLDVPLPFLSLCPPVSRVVTYLSGVLRVYGPSRCPRQGRARGRGGHPPQGETRGLWVHGQRSTMRSSTTNFGKRPLIGGWSSSLSGAARHSHTGRCRPSRCQTPRTPYLPVPVATPISSPQWNTHLRSESGGVRRDFMIPPLLGGSRSAWSDPGPSPCHPGNRKGGRVRTTPKPFGNEGTGERRRLTSTQGRVLTESCCHTGSYRLL